MDILPYELNQQLNINSLPPELLTKIFYNLDSVNDLLKCRLVNKQWKTMIESNLRIKELVMFRSTNSLDKYYHEFTFKSVENDHFLLTGNLNILISSFKIVFHNLKTLSIDLCYNSIKDPFDIFDYINQFINLEHLEINYLKVKNNGTLNLPNLKSLSIENFSHLFHTQKKVKLNTPKLKSLHLSNFLDRFEFAYPESVINLITLVYQSNVSQFVNLESYDLKYLSNDFNDHAANILYLLPKFKRLNCFSSAKKSIISSILQIKNKKRLDFKFYYFGLEITCKNDLDGFDEMNDYLITINKTKYFQMILDNHYKLEQLLPNITKIDYNSLIDFYKNNRFDSAFFGKFVNVRKLVVTGLVNEERLIGFMKNYKLLCLKFFDCKFNQQFFDNLPISQSRIEKLVIIKNDDDTNDHKDDTDDDKEQKLSNCNFISKLDYLDVFETNLKIPCSFVSSILRESDCFSKFKFKFNDKLDVIVYYDDDYSIVISDEVIDFEESYEIVEFLNRLDHFQCL